MGSRTCGYKKHPERSSRKISGKALYSPRHRAKSPTGADPAGRSPVAKRGPAAVVGPRLIPPVAADANSHRRVEEPHPRSVVVVVVAAVAVVAAHSEAG
jgi:hypothetical protein